MDDPAVIRQRGMDMAGETLHMLRQRQEEQEQRLHAPQGSAVEPAWTPPTLGPAQPVRRAVAPRQRPPPAPPMPDKITRVQHDGSGRITATESYTGAGAAAARSWQGYIEDRIGAQILDFAKEFGAGIGEVLAEIRTAEREATAVHLAALEARIAMLEERLAGSRQSEEFRHAAD